MNDILNIRIGFIFLTRKGRMYLNSFVQGCKAELDRIPFPTIQTARYVKVSILEYEDDGAAITYIGVETVVGKNISNNSVKLVL